MRILLLTPPYEKFEYKVGESLGIRYIASLLSERGHKAEVFEPHLIGYDIKATVNEILKRDCDIVGISTTYGLFKRTVELVKLLRKNDYSGHIIVGGHFATFEYRKILEKVGEIDAVCVGEGEFPIEEFLEKGESKSIATRDNLSPQPTFVEDLDSLLFPYRDDLKDNNLKRIRTEHFSILSSRGCYGNCSFCSVRAFYKGLRRFRSPKNVVDEIEVLLEDFKARAISFVDDNFLMNKKRAIEIAREIRDRNLDIRFVISARSNDINKEVISELRKAGLKAVEVGLESASDEQLKRYRKGSTVEVNIKAIELLRELNVRVVPFFINFDPYVTLDEIRMNIEFMIKYNLVTFSNISNKAIPYPGTLMFEELRRKNMLIEGYWEYTYEFMNLGVKKIYNRIQTAKCLHVVDLIKQSLEYEIDVHDKDYLDVVTHIEEKFKYFANKIFENVKLHTIAEEIAFEIWEITPRNIRDMLSQW